MERANPGPEGGASLFRSGFCVDRAIRSGAGEPGLPGGRPVSDPTLWAGRGTDAMSDGEVPDGGAAQPPRPEYDGGTGGSDLPLTRTRLEVPGRVFVQAIIATLLTYAILRFFTQVLGVVVLVAMALILAAILAPLAGWLERHKVKRGLAALIGIALVVLILLALLGLVIPPLVIQGIEFANTLPALIDRWQLELAQYPDITRALESVAAKLQQDPAAIFSGFLRFGLNAASALFGFVLWLTLTLYFLMDRERIRAAVLRQVPAEYKDRADLTLVETARLVRAYFVGQVIVSSIFATYTFVLLTVLGIPYAAILAALGFFLAGIPNIGSLIATVLPALLALTQSLTKAIIVAAAIIIYNQIENNLISPRILGRRLQIPPVLTMIAILVGGALFGILGIIIAIPLAGVVPVIERIWLQRDEVRGEVGTGG